MVTRKLTTRVVPWVVVLTMVGASLASCAAPAAPTVEPAAPTAAVEEAAAPTEAAVPTEAAASEQVVLNIMDNWGAEENAKGPPLHAAFEEFMAENPNIKIEEQVFGDAEIPTKVVTMYMAGDEPDIVFQNLHQAALDWLDDGVTVDMTDLSKQWGLYDQIKPSANTEWTDAEGRLNAIPLEGYDWPIWYNTKILDEAGVVGIPQTVDELIAAAEKIRAAGYQPFTTGGMEWTGEFVFFLTLASMLTDQEIPELYAKGGFADNPHARAAVEAFVKMRDAGVFADNVEGMTVASSNEDFYSEKAAMMHGGSWFFAETPDEIKDHVVLGGMPLPSESPRSKPAIYSSFEGKGAWVTRNGSAKMDAVEKFIKFFYQPRIMGRFVEDAAMTSPLIDTPVDETKLDPLFVKSTQLGDDVEVALIHKVYVPPAADENLRRVAREAFVPGTSVDTILAHMDEVYSDLQ